MLASSRAFRVVKQLYNRGAISKEVVTSYIDRMSPVLTAIQSKGKRKADDQDRWDAIRNLFAYDDNTDCTPINAANLCPTFDAVQQIVNEFQLRLNLDVAIQKRVGVLRIVIDEACEVIAKQFGVESTEIALVRNTTEANCAVNNGLPLGLGDEVVIWAQNHRANNTAWSIRQQQKPFTIKTVPSDLNGETSTDDIVQSFVSQLTEKTKVVTFSHLSNESGLLLPAKEICQGVHAFNSDIHVHIDGAMTWGAMPLNLKDMDCDSYGSSGHKWFLGPKEAGILYMRLPRATKFMPNIFGYDGKSGVPPVLYGDARRFQTFGQRSEPTLMGLLITAEILGFIGFEAITDRIAFLGNMVFDGFQELGFPITTPADPDRRLGVIVAGVPRDFGVSLYNYLYDTHRIGVASTGGLRASPTLCNTEEQMTRLIDAIKQYPEQPQNLKNLKN